MSEVEFTVKNSIATVTLKRAHRLNAITLAMWRDIARIFTDLAADPRVRSIILTGAGDNFSVGADITEFVSVRDNVKQSVEYEAAVDQASEAIANTFKPVIAAISGYCLGGGCHLSLACDFRFLHDNAKIGIPAARLSIVYGINSTKRLVSIVGPMHAKYLLFSARNIDAVTALRFGLATGTSNEPLQQALELATEIAKNAPLSISGTKHIINSTSIGDGSLDTAHAQDLVDTASKSQDYAEGRLAFTEKREAVFKGQ